MRATKRRLCALLTLTAIAAWSPAAAAVAHGAAPRSGAASRSANALHVGQSWTQYSMPTSPSGEFTLYVEWYGLQLDEHITTGGGGIGTTSWSSRRVHANCGRPKLTMMRSGAAVLHCHGHRLWATPTRGTGHDNTLRLRDNGEVVVTNNRGRVVWRSGSGRALLGTAGRLQPGQELRDCSMQHTACDRLTMFRSGDLVLHRAHRIAWRTGTHTAGSRFALLRGGNMVVQGPHGRVLWSSHTNGFGKSAYLIVGSNSAGTGARIDLASVRRGHKSWYRQ